MFVPFFQQSLSEVTFNNPAIEAFLAPVVRKAFLVLKPASEFEKLKSLVHAIGLQCYRNSFAWPYSPEEKKKVNTLVEETKKILAGAPPVTNGVLDKTLYHHLSLIALYRSLAEFEGLAEVVKQLDKSKLDKWFVEVLKKSIEDPIAEGNLVHSIKSITPISDATQGKRRLYIWDNAGMSQGRLAKITVKEELETLYRYHPHGFDGPSSTKILVVGCGSGQEIFQTAVTYSNVDIYAVDPTIDNLTYALRQNNELGVHPHLYVADIQQLDLSAFPQPFDVVTSNCTLSLVENPVTALARIAGLLRPGGVAKLQVYSRRYVDNIRVVREFLRTKLSNGSTMIDRRTGENGLPIVLRKPTDEEARKAREILFQTEDEKIQNAILMSPSFYSLAEFVDLVFHEHITVFNFQEVGELLNHAGLNLVSFDFPQIQPEKAMQYQEETGDMNLIDVDKLTEFEQKDPEAFQNIMLTISFIAEKPISQ
jgi:ubiquinone/menaquinone biosynthesis C-methylase UbiE